MSIDSPVSMSIKSSILALQKKQVFSFKSCLSIQILQELEKRKSVNRENYDFWKEKKKTNLW